MKIDIGQLRYMSITVCVFLFTVHIISDCKYRLRRAVLSSHPTRMEIVSIHKLLCYMVYNIGK